MASLYLGGLSLNAVAKKMGIGWGARVHKILWTAEDHYTVHFDSKMNGIKEDIEIRIPPLLSADTMEKIRQKADDHRNWDRKQQKYQYLLAGLIYDQITGKTMSGARIRRDIYRYYRLTRRPYGTENIKNFYSVRANAIEEAVINELFHTLGDSQTLRKAVHEGHPLGRVAKKLQAEKADHEKELASVKRKMENFKRMIGDYEGDEIGDFLQSIKPKIKELDSRHKEIIGKIQGVENQLKTLPTEKEIEEKRTTIWNALQKITADRIWQEGAAFHHLPFPEKKKLVNLIFAGKDEQGRRCGVYVRPLQNAGARFEAYGRLGTLSGFTGAIPIYDDVSMDVDDKMVGKIIEAVEGAIQIPKKIKALKPSSGRRLIAIQSVAIQRQLSWFFASANRDFFSVKQE